MKKPITGSLAQFNQLYREMDEIYHRYAQSHSISDTALWLLYSLYEEGNTYTQRELCAAWHVPPQTVNSALKKLANQGLIALEPVPGNQKNKQILLTEKGLELSRQVILPLVQAEQTVFQELGEEPQAALLSLTKRYVTLLHTKLN